MVRVNERGGGYLELPCGSGCGTLLHAWPACNMDAEHPTAKTSSPVDADVPDGPGRSLSTSLAPGRPPQPRHRRGATRLVLGNNNAIGPTGAAHVGAGCPLLAALHVGDNNDLQAEGLAAIVRRCGRLSGVRGATLLPV